MNPMSYIVLAYSITFAALAGLTGFTALRIRRAQKQWETLHGS